MIIPVASGNFNRLISSIQDHTQKVKIGTPFDNELTILPNVNFSGDEAFFSFQFNIELKQGVILKLKQLCMDVVKTILSSVKVDVFDENLGEFTYQFVRDEIKKDFFTSKNYKAVVLYKQIWKLNLQ